MDIAQIAEEQAKELGPEMLDLMSAANEAQEICTLDELEEWAREHRIQG